MDEREEVLLQEIDAIRAEAAQARVALATERDHYQSALNLAYSTKAWRASLAYWTARRMGVRAPFYLASVFARYVARVTYHLVIPYRRREEWWVRRHAGRSYWANGSTVGPTQGSGHAPASRPALPDGQGPLSADDGRFGGSRVQILFAFR